MMRFFHRLSLWTLMAVYFLILVGGIVRSTGSGMGCPDWPKCFGQWVPPTAVDQLPADYKEHYAAYREKKNIKFARYLTALGMGDTAERLLSDETVLEEADFNPTKTWIEYVNRLVGVVIGMLIFAVMVVGVRIRKIDPVGFVVAVVTFVLVVFQGWIGSFVVSSNLTPWTVTVHMFLAMLIVFLLVMLVHRSKPELRLISGQLPQVLVLACIAVLLIQVLMGTKVRETLDLIAQYTPRVGWISAAGQDFIIHRSFSWVVVILHAVLVWRMIKSESSRVFPLVLIVLVLGTVASGIGMAYQGVPPVLQPVHLLLATLAFGALTFLLLQVNRSTKLGLS